MPVTLRYVRLNVFTDRPLTGNPLVVFTNARGLSAELMQAIAREMNLSETTFVLPSERGGHARVRIFTPQSELPFAGHPTLGTAFALGGPLQVERVVLELEAGLVPVDLEREGPRVAFGWMQTPPLQPLPVDSARLAGVLRGLGIPEPAGPVGVYRNGPEHWCVPLPSQRAVAELRPDMALLGESCHARMTVSAFCFADGVCKTRAFAPAAGVPEDPATGSAAAALAAHLVHTGQVSENEEVQLIQGAEVGRPSTLYACAGGATAAGQPLAVRVGGAAVVLGRGELRL